MIPLTCRPNPVKSTPCGIKDTHKYLQQNPYKRRSTVATRAKLDTKTNSRRLTRNPILGT
ncbi:hypothetical protein B7P43_G05017 [Cryptotermes secundus]|uniref:Uncharacterized protein n=1 Tax=Cryptotermes secundus TaxID=105785 RepID=A0A2J7PQY4_9NEOP|nr:hypothetical protein B7P43_G05017 [Cryptotermes secundus]